MLVNTTHSYHKTCQPGLKAGIVNGNVWHWFKHLNSIWSAKFPQKLSELVIHRQLCVYHIFLVGFETEGVCSVNMNVRVYLLLNHNLSALPARGRRVWAEITVQQNCPWITLMQTLHWIDGVESLFNVLNPHNLAITSLFSTAPWDKNVVPQKSLFCTVDLQEQYWPVARVQKENQK